MKQIPVSKIQLVDIQYQAHMDYIYNVESGDSIRLFPLNKNKTDMALIYVVNILHTQPTYT